MPSRELPPRPHLDHLKNEAKALRNAFLRGEPDAVERVRAVLGPRTDLKLTEAQRVIAREYGFASWAKLRSHVQASRGFDDAVAAFLAAVEAGDTERALGVVRAEPRLATSSLHVAAVLGLEAEVRRMVAADPALVRSRAGERPAEPLLWLCFSPFHGESSERDDGLAACARALLDAGAEPNTRDARYGVPALYAVTGYHNVPRIARMLLEAGAEPTDGESVFHAAERFHVESLELLREFGVDLNHTGDWGNTPLYFLLEHHDIEQDARVRQGMLWLLEHGADPNVPCGRDQETSLHVAVRRGQGTDIVRLLLDHGADVHARRADGRTAWVLAERGGFDELKALLEEAGATPEPLAREDLLLAACGRGDEDAARRLSSPDLVAALESSASRMMIEAARKGRVDVVRAYLAAGFPVGALDQNGATALHYACIAGRAAVVRELITRGAELDLQDREHEGTPVDWACYGADHDPAPDGDYTGCVRALLEAGARPRPPEWWPQHAGIREVFERYARA